MMYFVAAQFSDAKIQELFNVARLVVEGDYARRTHITLRGPYKSKHDINKSIFDKDAGKITLRKPGTFFSEHQSTVFISVQIFGLGDLWYKPDFPEGSPHLTIYDGDDRRFAWAVFSTLKRHKWNLNLNSSRLTILEKKRTVEDDFLDSERYPAKLLERFAGRSVAAQEIRQLSELSRVTLLDRICREIHELTHPSSTR